MHRSPIRGVDAMELASNHAFPRHTHDQYGIGVVLSGAQRSWSGIGQVESFPGDVITVNPGEVHDGIPLEGCVRRWRIIYFDPTLLVPEPISETDREIEFAKPSLRDPELGQLVHSLFYNISVERDRLAVEECLVRAIGRLVPSEHRPSAFGHLTPPTAKARARIEDDPACRITLSELAALSDVSRYQIVRAFARELGTTPHAYVVQCRVRLARQLLLSGETLASVAQHAGFADQSHMTRAYVRQFGITPGRYQAARQ
jgi:AraC-like DNA-binding protein